MTQRVRFLVDCYRVGVVKYRAGQHYPATPETLSQVGQGSADLVDVAIDVKQNATETAAALAAWNQENEGTIYADPALRSDPNPAATLVKHALAELGR